MVVEKCLPFSFFSAGTTWKELADLLTAETTPFPDLSSSRIKHVLVEVFIATKKVGYFLPLSFHSLREQLHTVKVLELAGGGATHQLILILQSQLKREENVVAKTIKRPAGGLRPGDDPEKNEKNLVVCSIRCFLAVQAAFPFSLFVILSAILCTISRNINPLKRRYRRSLPHDGIEG